MELHCHAKLLDLVTSTDGYAVGDHAWLQAAKELRHHVPGASTLMKLHAADGLHGSKAIRILKQKFRKYKTETMSRIPVRLLEGPP